MKGIVIFFTLFLVTVLLLLPNQSLATTKVFEREYTYQASEADSKLSCRTIALEQVKRLLLEELGTYLESETEVKDLQLTRDQITTLTAGVVWAKIVFEDWDGQVYRLRARIKADPDQVAKAIFRLCQDRKKNKELVEVRARAEQYLKEIDRLKQEMVSIKGEALRLKQIEYGETVKKLSAAEWFKRGLYFDNSQRYEEAIKAYTKALEINPHYIAAYNNRGNAWREKGDFERSLVDFNKILEINPNLAYAYIGRGNALGDKGNFYGAIADYNRALEISPKFAEAYHNRGFVWAQIGDHTRAITDYTKAIEINPDYADAYIHRGNAWSEKHNFDGAIADYTKALEINPRYAMAYNNRGQEWWRRGNYNKAITDYTKAIEINPDYANAYCDRGTCWRDKGNLERAIADYTKALEINPREVLAWRGRGATWMMKGDFRQGLADVRRALSLTPNDKELQAAIVVLEAEVKRKKMLNQ